MIDNKNDDENVLKAISITPAITALLKPTAVYLGTELRDFVKGTVEEWKSKRREKNIAAHLDGVRMKLATEPSINSHEDPTFEQLDLLDSWIESAQDVDPENIELSEIWRNLLVRAARGGSTSSEVVNALKALTPKEAQFLSDFDRRQSSSILIFPSIDSDKKLYLSKALESKGILEKDYAFGLSFIVTTILLGFSAYYFVDRTNIDFKLEVMLSVGVVISFLVVISLQSALRRWRLSWLGNELFRLVKGDIANTRRAH